MVSVLGASVVAGIAAADGPPAVGAAGIAWRIAVVLGLVLANAFFVAAEFALIAVRRGRIENRVAAGDRGARLVERTLKDLDRYISATQVGIALASLALGWLGEDAIAVLIDGALGQFGLAMPAAALHTTAAAITAFVVIAFLHIVLGQLTPKTLALVRPERTSALVVRPLIGFSILTAPFIA